MPADGRKQFQNEPGLAGLQPAFYKGCRESFGTDFRAILPTFQYWPKY